MQQDIDTIKSEIKENIEALIYNKKLVEAKVLIDEYAKMVPDDIDIYSLDAEIAIMLSKLEEAEEIIRCGLKRDNNNYDLLYNLAFVYEIKEEFEDALKYYRIVFWNTKDDNLKLNIKNVVKKILILINSEDTSKDFLDISKRMKKCLILCHFYSVYTKEFLEKLHTSIEFDILTTDNSYKTNVSEDALDNVYLYKDLEEMYNILNNYDKYDIIHIHYLTPYYSDLAEKIRSKCNKLVITIWGSDFYRTTNEQKKQQMKLIETADIITFDNEVTCDEFLQYYGENLRTKTKINRFGLTALEYIDNLKSTEKVIKEEFGLPEDSIVITCGYNANQAHNHLEIIKSLKHFKNRLPKNLYYIFPMTYSRNQTYCNKVKKELYNSGLKYLILEEFMNFDEIAKLTKVTDIMVQVQTTDTLSATMQEHMYNGNVVITGSWLPYQPLKKEGLYFLDISSLDKLGKKLEYAVKNLSTIKGRTEKNKHIIWNYSSWEKTIDLWLSLYENNSTYIGEKKFDHKEFWNNRYLNKYTIESAGYMGLGEEYNEYLYKSKLEILQYVVKKFNIYLSKERVLELGPGTGIFTDYFYNKSVGKYKGVDISDVAVKKLSEKYRRFCFETGDISELNKQDINEKYDVIFSAGVFLHLIEKNKFAEALKNVSLLLEENGYFIQIDPITLIGSKIDSPYNKLIDITELKEELKINNLEIVNMIPTAFFMENPFDYKMLSEVGERAISAFNNIYSYFSSSNNSQEYKNLITKLIYLADKMCLLKFNNGLTSKFLIIRKISNSEYLNVEINEIWDIKDLQNEINQLKELLNGKIDDNYLKLIFRDVNYIIGEKII